MKCFSCKEELSEKFKHALSQNVCPFCGRGIFSPADFHFRKSLGDILVQNGVAGQERILKIITDIEGMINGASIPDASGGSGGVGVVSGESTATGTIATNMPSDVITESDFEGAPPTTEEAAEVQAMLESGELVLSNVMEVTDNKKRAMLNKPIPRPVSRL
jgi:hypothetical protein